jgi:hypothetical protein
MSKMSSPTRQPLVLLFVLVAISAACAQRAAYSALPPAPDSSPAGYSSSREGIFSGSPGADPSADGASAASGAVRNQRPAYAASRTWLFAENGIGAFVSPLGLGIGAATTLSGALNLRAAGNLFGYNLSGDSQGVNYQGTLSFRSIQANVDWFPWHKSFHLSPGVLFYNQNQITVHGGVAAGQSFTVNGATYYSGAADPVTL